MCNPHFYRKPTSSFLLVLLLTLGSACISDVPDFEKKTQNKILMMGYIGTQEEVAQLSIMRSVALEDKLKNFDLVSNAIVRLIEISPTNETMVYPMSFNGFYYQSETLLAAKSGFQYQVEVQVSNKSYKSKMQTLNHHPPSVEFTQLEGLEDQFKRWKITVVDTFGNFSYITDASTASGGFELFNAMRRYSYQDKKFRDGNAHERTFYFPAEEAFSVWAYVIQIPHEVDEFFRQWDAQNFSNEEGEDFFEQMFRVNPGNLKSNFKSENDGIAEEVIGVFFPTHTYLKKN